MDGPVEDELIEAYIGRYCQPVQWVGWWMAAQDSVAKESLSAALFDPETDALADLTAPSVRDAVIRAVLASPALRAAVRSEVDRLLDSAAEGAMDEDEQDD